MKNAKKDLPELLTKLRAVNAVLVEVSFYGGGDEGSIDEICGANGEDDAVEEFCDALLEEVGVDWYNNEGGNGEIEIDVVAGRVTYTVNQNEVVSREAASGTIE